MGNLIHTQINVALPVSLPKVSIDSLTDRILSKPFGLPSWVQEDQGFKKARPSRFYSIAVRLKESRATREKRIEQMINQLSLTCQKAGLNAEITGRPKHIFSIYKKMQNKGLHLKEVLDLNGIRMILMDTATCYDALDMVHRLWAPVPELFDDYIKHPKPSGYQSLHTTVHPFNGSCLEVQIRTKIMHREAESGRAAHWRYKKWENA